MTFFQVSFIPRTELCTCRHGIGARRLPHLACLSCVEGSTPIAPLRPVITAGARRPALRSSTRMIDFSVAPTPHSSGSLPLHGAPLTARISKQFSSVSPNFLAGSGKIQQWVVRARHCNEHNTWQTDANCGTVRYYWELYYSSEGIDLAARLVERNLEISQLRGACDGAKS